MYNSDSAEQIKTLIRRHLEEVGAADWKKVRVQCPEISDATFWRYVKNVREEENKEVDHKPTATTPRPAAEDAIPSLGALPAFYDPLQKARQYEFLLSDAEALRAHSVDRHGKITNARQFEKSILLRERLLSQQAEMMNFFQSQETAKLFFEEILEFAADLPEEAKQTLMARLYELQQQRLAPP